MKNNEDFLKGIYEKAEILEKEKKDEKEKYSYNKFLKYSSIAAMFIIIPILLLQSNIFKDNEPAPINEPRIVSFGNIDYSFSNAEYIVKGKIQSINNIGDQSEITLLVEEKLYGDEVADEIKVLGSSGIEEFLKDSREIIVLLIKEEEKYLLFNDNEGILIQDNPNSYIDVFGNKYLIEEIEEIIDRRR